jgi:hypothetical protein
MVICNSNIQSGIYVEKHFTSISQLIRYSRTCLSYQLSFIEVWYYKGRYWTKVNYRGKVEVVISKVLRPPSWLIEPLWIFELQMTMDMLHRECIAIFTEKENKIKLCLAFMRCVRSYNITRKFNPTSNCQKKNIILNLDGIHPTYFL